MVPKIGKNLEGCRTDTSTVKISDKFRPGVLMQFASSSSCSLLVTAIAAVSSSILFVQFVVDVGLLLLVVV